MGAFLAVGWGKLEHWDETGEVSFSSCEPMALSKVSRPWHWRSRASACHHVFPTEDILQNCTFLAVEAGKTWSPWLPPQHCLDLSPEGLQVLLEALDIPNSLTFCPSRVWHFTSSFPLALWDSLTIFACQITTADFEEGSNVKLSLPKESFYLLNNM